jgi:ribonuclease HII
VLKKFFRKNIAEAGCDEAGRGCLAGPVFAAAVRLPKKFFHPLLNDSKQMTEEARDLLRPVIEKEAIAWAVAQVSQQVIDEMNILQASILAMHQALDQFAEIPELILVDGNYFKAYKTVPHKCIIKGDEKFTSIAAASVLAKTHRDEYMKKLHPFFPHYNWQQNKGYATEEHRTQILFHGICEHHRKTFRMTNDEELPEEFMEQSIIPSSKNS